VLDVSTLAIQELLRHYSHLEAPQLPEWEAGSMQPQGVAGAGAADGSGGSGDAAEGNLLFNSLPAELQVRLGCRGGEEMSCVGVGKARYIGWAGWGQVVRFVTVVSRWS